MAYLEVEYRGPSAIVHINRESTNPIDLQLIRQLAETLNGLKDDSNVKSIVLCSTNDKFFSIGFNIPTLYTLNEKDFKVFYQAFNRLCIDLYTFPKPTVAAITGHAIAGGCILALCCDYRCIAEGRKLMGLNEVKLGVPVPYPGDCILRQLVGSRYSREILDFGKFYNSEESLRMGLADTVVPLEQVLSQSIERAHTLGAMPVKAFQMIKRNRTWMIETQIKEYLEEKEAFFIECWYSDETRIRLKEAMKKF